ncbi:MAG: recombinase family protein [Sphingomicrobium sp.]
MRTFRCAIYTRKSTEEGLDQVFNTLHAQREACEAYIKSQAGEGWKALPDQYDDGGFSGGNMDRPAIKQLLADVDAGKVDVIVVYKVDRLTRSLMDFARIVERLDARGVSFVSVTQAFNTTTSMGRLTLNVLLSFAQFEREVTGERIRDKIAASKAKGMWMGGNVPLGYDLGDRKLVVNRSEAEQVQHIFGRYAALRSGVALMKELLQDGYVSKCWTGRSGQERGGKPFSCGALYYLLQNPLYVGEIAHKGKLHCGDHDALIGRQLFDEVQHLIASNRNARKERSTRAAECQLAGLVFERDTEPLTTSFSYGRGGRMYRYYVSSGLLPSATTSETLSRDRRVPSAPLEHLVLSSVQELLGAALAWEQVRKLLARVELWDRSVQLLLDLSSLLEPHEQLSALAARLNTRLNNSTLVVEGEMLRLIHHRAPQFRGGIKYAGAVEACPPNNLAVQVRQAHTLLEQYAMSPLTPDRHADASAPANHRERWRMHLGLLAPSIQKQALSRTAVNIDSAHLLPLAWADQDCVS